MTTKKTEWNFKKIDNELAGSIEEKYKISNIVSKVISNRFKNLKEFNDFRSKNNTFHSPFEIKDMEKAIKRIKEGIANKEKIIIYGDYDADGCTSTALLYNFFKNELNYEIDFFIPTRKEGYGLNKKSLKDLYDDGFRLVITVDCGIKGGESIDFGNDLGLNFIITDHHTPPDKMPLCNAVINPKQKDCPYPFEDLAGVGVAFKLIQALAIDYNLKIDFNKYLPLVMIGTVADLVPLRGENRKIVEEGLKNIQNNTNFNLEVLLKELRLEGKDLNTRHIGFNIAPLINAAGRMENPKLVVDFFLNEDKNRTIKQANYLNKLNQKRKVDSKSLTNKAIETINCMELHKDKVIVLSGNNLNGGIVGNIASNLVNEFQKPVVFITFNEKDIGTASCRSVKGFNIYKALEYSQDLLLRFGGHKEAAGLSIEKSNFLKFREKINKYAEEESKDCKFLNELEIDCKIKPEEISLDLIKEFSLLEPFGMTNQQPVFMFEKFKVENFELFGQNKDHLKIKIANGIELISYYGENLRKYLLVNNENIDVVFTLDINEWRGRKKIQLIMKDIFIPLTFSDELFADKDRILNKKNESIAKKQCFYEKIAGVSFDGRQDKIKNYVNVGDEIFLKREPNNEFDSNAIKLLTKEGQDLGYIPKNTAKHISMCIDNGRKYKITVSDVTGGNIEDYNTGGRNIENHNIGVNIMLNIDDGTNEKNTEDTNEKRREDLKDKEKTVILEEVREILIGEYDYREKQKEALNHLFNQKNTLAVFGTGRGKSAIFQTFSIIEAIKKEKMSIFIYPLRALVNDQYKDLKEKLDVLNLKVAKASGGLNPFERKKLKKDLKEGKIDIVLTTPEFLDYNISLFEDSSKEISFLGIDESHHISLSTENFRPVYKNFSKIIDKLNNPLILAATATANTKVAEDIIQKLKIKELVIDDHIRSNLKILDERNHKNKTEYINQIVKEGEKTIIYANSKKKTIELSEKLISLNPDMKDEIIFYNSGLETKERNIIEEGFKNGDFKTVVSTSAFGEGINIPNIRNVILYHLNFNMVDFNQQTGRSGRDGKKAHIHLLYGVSDVNINEFILKNICPDINFLKMLYKIIFSKKNESNMLFINQSQIKSFLRINGFNDATESSVINGLKIFEELKILNFETDKKNEEEDEILKSISFNPVNKINIEDSLIYIEGKRHKQAFENFKPLALYKEKENLLRKINQPIYPDKLIKVINTATNQ